MSTIRVRGIDRDDNSRLVITEGLTASHLAELLCHGHWRYALLTASDGRPIGEVTFSTDRRARTWWADDSEEGAENSL